MQKLKIRTVLTVLAVIATLSLIVIAGFGLMSLRSTMIADRHGKIQALVETAHNTVEHYYKAEQAGKMTEKQAQEAAKDALRQLRYDGSNYFFIGGYDYHVVMHTVKPSLEGKDVKNEQDPNGVYIWQKIIAAAKQGAGFVNYEWPKAGSNKPVPKVSYVMGFDPWQWAIATGIYLDDVNVAFRKAATAYGIVCALCVLLLGGIAFVVSRGIGRSIGGLSAKMRAVAGGDLSVGIDEQALKTEIGEMAQALQVFKDNAVEKQRLEAEQKEAARRSEEEKRKALAAIADSFEATVGEVVQSVSSQSTQFQGNATTMSTIAEKTGQQSLAVAAAAEEASTNVQTVAAAAEELSRSIQEINQQLAQSSTMAREAVGEVERTNATVDGLAAAAQRIGDVVKLIQDIAEQTNLLALNATIEAARAGEAGKGFAVVASEVKELANQTAKATEEIAGQITGIQDASGEAVSAIQTIGRSIVSIDEAVTAIAAAAEEQGAATDEISRNVQQAANGTQQVSSNIGEVTSAAGETGSMAGEVLKAAGVLLGEAGRLRDEVAGFLRNVRTA